ncbi:MAG: TIGR01777 family oxidoreductase [Pseudobdellovibrionaceae bacterium]
MKVLITGATGLVGKELGKKLTDDGPEVVVVSRQKEKAQLECPFPCEVIEADLQKEEIPAESLRGIDAVIHLMGENVGDGRWSDEKKKRIYDSRVKSSENLIESFRRAPPKVMISASAVGFYGDRSDEALSEESSVGEDFLAQVCQDWERGFAVASTKPAFSQVRFLNFRIGVVLSEKGGALPKMIPPFRVGLGGALGKGQQWMSWIHLTDLVELFCWALKNETMVGPVNAVAPESVTNRTFSEELAKQFGKKLGPSVPALGLKLVLGEMSWILLASQNVQPRKITKAGFKFQFATLTEALSDLTKDMKNGEFLFTAEQWLPFERKKVFPYFAEARNLEKITPPLLNFHIKKVSTPEIQKGTLIDYRLKIHGIPIAWRTLIERWNPDLEFVDTQLKGPYSLWHHTHTFTDLKGGTLMIDRVKYKLPFGFLGWVVAGWMVEKDVKNIFAYRRQIVAKERF